MRGRLRRGLQHIARFAIARRRGLAIGAAVLASAAIAFLAARRSIGFWAIDDAGITYAAALEYADHGSLGANVEGTPVESYSNPLVFFVVVALRWLGVFDPVATHLRIEALLFAVMVVLVWSTLRRLTGELAALAGAGMFAAIELITASTWLWYGSGLENVWVSTGLVALLWLCVRTVDGAPLSPAWGVLAFLVALTRPESPVYVAGFYVALAVCARPPELAGTERAWRAHARQVAAALAVTTVLYAAFLCWRRISYGDWLPNTYYAKIWGKPDLLHNLRESVIANILPYSRAGLFACSAIALLCMRRFTRIACTLLVLLVASLALPITAGEDWAMGERRFATPFLAMTHASLAMLVAVCVMTARGARLRAWRLVAIGTLLVIVALAGALLSKRFHRRRAIPIDDVTIARIGAEQGGLRWEHQMRLGVPFAVTMLPDAGGSVLVGGMQFLDNGYLADFVMAHMGRYFGDPVLLRQLNQYQHEERRPDLVERSTAIGAFDTSYVGTRYLAGDGHLLARRDLVVVPAVDANARLVFDDGQLQVYVSSETEPTAAPGALVRCELIVAWTDAAVDRVRLRGAIEGGDSDEISLRPYQKGARGIERRALLLGAPARTGPAPATLDVVRDDRVVFHGPLLTLDLRSDDAGVAQAVERIVADRSTMRAARRLAWLREQRIPRLGMTGFRRTVRELIARDKRHGSLAGENLLQLRWNARLASFEPVPAAIRAAEVEIARRLFAACPAGEPTRVACLGRVVDELRRLGTLGILARIPDVAGELARARASLDILPPEQRYQALVGLTLADPMSIALQRDLIALRRALPRYPELANVTDHRAPPADGNR